MSFTYGQLKQAIQDYTENTETSFVNNLPLFIRMAEERILKQVQLSLFRKNVSGSTTPGNKYLAAPSDFLAPFSLGLAGSDGDKFFLEYKDPSFIQEYTPDATTTGKPRYFAQFDNENFILAATPDEAYTAELHYFYRPASLTEQPDNGTTWLSINAEMAMLYGALLEANIFIKGEQDVMQAYAQRLQESIAGLKQLGEAKEVTDEYRRGKVIRPKQ